MLIMVCYDKIGLLSVRKQSILVDWRGCWLDVARQVRMCVCISYITTFRFLKQTQFVFQNMLILLDNVIKQINHIYPTPKTRKVSLLSLLTFILSNKSYLQMHHRSTNYECLMVVLFMIAFTILIFLIKERARVVRKGTSLFNLHYHITTLFLTIEITSFQRQHLYSRRGDEANLSLNISLP